jgi:uncharacterized repeat protein (TIGR03803 family)
MRASPQASLIGDNEGALYGTAESGGNSACAPNGCGVVFKLTPPGKGQTAWRETVLYSFSGSDGNAPQAGLIADNWGALYGTTAGGGGAGYGAVFKLTPPAKGQTTWRETVLYSFTGGSDGGSPLAPLIADNEGALYGTTTFGGNYSACGGTGCGVVFKLTPPGKGHTVWTETVLHTFANGSDGANPHDGLVADQRGALYGTTYQGGSSGGSGTVFKLTP